MAAVPYIWWRGFRMTPEFRDAIQAAEKRAGFAFSVTQGGFNAGGVAASAGTHDGDAADFSVYGPGRVLMSREEVATMIEALRWAGIFASLRTGKSSLYGVRAQGFVTRAGADMPHIHGVPNGWGSPSRGARDQAAAYRRGRDGLKGNGPDAGGPGHVSTHRSRTTPMKPTTTPGLPDSGDDPAAKPTQPEEDTLSTAEESRIMAQLNKRADEILEAVKGRAALEEVGKTVARHVWDGSFVYRGADKKQVTTKQELADAKSLATQAVALAAAHAEAERQSDGGGSVDYAKVGAVVREAIADTIKIGGAK